LAEPTPEAFAQQIQFAIENPLLRRERAHRGREVAMEFNWNDVSKRVFRIYDFLHEESTRELRHGNSTACPERNSSQAVEAEIS
jgi:hypothetical protein